MSRPQLLLFPVLAMFCLACGAQEADKPKDAPPSERAAEPEPETPKDAPKGPFAAFDFEAASAAWQGSWTLEGEMIGKQAAWMVDGTSLVESNGSEERKLEFAVYSPCQVTYTDTDKGTTTYKNFVVVEGALHTGLGSSGVVVGDTTIVCTGGKTYVLTGDECLAWSEMFDDWKSEPAECKIEGEGDARKFVAGRNEVPFISATALATKQLQGNVATKHPNFDAAKAALAPSP